MLPNGASWMADDLNDYNGAEIAAVTLEDNYVDIRVAPAVVGEPCVVTGLQPELTGLVLDNRTLTIAPGGQRRLEVRRLFGESVVHLFGEIPAGAASVTDS